MLSHSMRMKSFHLQMHRKIINLMRKYSEFSHLLSDATCRNQNKIYWTNNILSIYVQNWLLIDGKHASIHYCRWINSVFMPQKWWIFIEFSVKFKISRNKPTEIMLVLICVDESAEINEVHHFVTWLLDWNSDTKKRTSPMFQLNK